MDRAHEKLVMILERAPERLNEFLDQAATMIGPNILNSIPGHGATPSTRMVVLSQLTMQQNALPALVTHLEQVI